MITIAYVAIAVLMVIASIIYWIEEYKDSKDADANWLSTVGVVATILVVALLIYVAIEEVMLGFGMMRIDGQGLKGFGLTMFGFFGNYLIGMWCISFVDKRTDSVKIALKKRDEDRQLERVFSKSYIEAMLKMKQLAVDTSYFKWWVEGKKIELAREREYSYYGTSNSLLNAIQKIVNQSLGAEEKYKGEIIEAIMLTAKNTAKIGFLLNVLEDEAKMDFLLTSSGEKQRVLLLNDLEELVNEIEIELKKAERLQSKTKINSMNAELNSLRINSFSHIEDMKRGE